LVQPGKSFCKNGTRGRAELMEAQGFDPAPLNLSKANFNPAQLRWAAGNGRESGRWSGGASVDSAGIKEFIARLALEAARRAARLLLRPTETKPANPEVAKPETSRRRRRKRSCHQRSIRINCITSSTNPDAT